MLKTYGFHSFIQRPHFSQNVKNLFRANFLTPSDIAVYKLVLRQPLHDWNFRVTRHSRMSLGNYHWHLSGLCHFHAHSFGVSL